VPDAVVLGQHGRQGPGVGGDDVDAGVDVPAMDAADLFRRRGQRLDPPEVLVVLPVVVRQLGRDPAVENDAPLSGECRPDVLVCTDPLNRQSSLRQPCIMPGAETSRTSPSVRFPPPTGLSGAGTNSA
jgi:hypothetical protein